MSCATVLATFLTISISKILRSQHRDYFTCLNPGRR